ncbi:helix-turn-helix domain-containing protein [Rhizobiales bacterium]|nr:helix-turn-helix domain-containing protein [Hongsoonwoonella zoysiae]
MNDDFAGSPDAGRCLLSSEAEIDLIDFIARSLHPHLAAPAPADLIDLNKIRIVRATRAAIDAARPCHAMLHDLCRAAGVGPTWLHRCFRAVYGVSPAAYLRALRLREARSLLLDP